jgi:hypothetical protein
VESTYNGIEHLKQLKKHMKFTTPSLVGWMLGFCGCSISSHDDARVVATEERARSVHFAPHRSNTIGGQPTHDEARGTMSSQPKMLKNTVTMSFAITPCNHMKIR